MAELMTCDTLRSLACVSDGVCAPRSRHCPELFRPERLRHIRRDLPGHFTERPRTLYSAFCGYERSMQEAPESASPLHPVDRMPPAYYIFHCEVVNLHTHSEELVAALSPLRPSRGRYTGNAPWKRLTTRADSALRRPSPGKAA